MISTDKSITITNDQGRPFTFCLVAPGEHYGITGQAQNTSDEAIVEVYDATHAGDFRFRPQGQFVSSYYISTLREISPSHGLDLDGGVPEWNVNARNIREVIEFLH